MRAVSTRTRRLTLLSFLLLLASGAGAQAPNLSAWQRDSLPSSSAYGGRYRWVFAKRNSEWVVEQQAASRSQEDTLVLPKPNAFLAYRFSNSASRHVLRIDDGYLIGRNFGEFGGGLYFVSLDGKIAYEIDPVQRIRKIFEFNHRILATEGMQEGAILELYKQQGSWRVRELAQFPEAPTFIQPYHDELLMLSSQYLYRVTKDFRVLPLVRAPFAAWLSSVSGMLVDQEDLYIATNTGVLRIKRFQKSPVYESGVIRVRDFENAPEFEWYVPKK